MSVKKIGIVVMVLIAVFIAMGLNKVYGLDKTDASTTQNTPSTNKQISIRIKAVNEIGGNAVEGGKYTLNATDQRYPAEFPKNYYLEDGPIFESFTGDSNSKCKYTITQESTGKVFYFMIAYDKNGYITEVWQEDSTQYKVQYDGSDNSTYVDVQIIDETSTKEVQNSVTLHFMVVFLEKSEKGEIDYRKMVDDGFYRMKSNSSGSSYRDGVLTGIIDLKKGKHVYEIEQVDCGSYYEFSNIKLALTYDRDIDKVSGYVDLGSEYENLTIAHQLWGLDHGLLLVKIGVPKKTEENSKKNETPNVQGVTTVKYDDVGDGGSRFYEIVIDEDYNVTKNIRHTSSAVGFPTSYETVEMSLDEDTKQNLKDIILKLKKESSYVDESNMDGNNIILLSYDKFWIKFSDGNSAFCKEDYDDENCDFYKLKRILIYKKAGEN